jgi:hypothetical protein
MPETKIKVKTGRPPLKPPSDALTAIKQAAAGGANKRGVAMALGVHVETMNRWLDEDPALREAFEQGRETERQVLHNAVYQRAIGDGKEALLAAMYLLNTKHGYAKEQASEANRVSITFALPGAMPLDKFVIENDPNPRAK